MLWDLKTKELTLIDFGTANVVESPQLLGTAAYEPPETIVRRWLLDPDSKNRTDDLKVQAKKAVGWDMSDTSAEIPKTNLKGEVFTLAVNTYVLMTGEKLQPNLTAFALEMSILEGQYTTVTKALSDSFLQSQGLNPTNARLTLA